MSYVLADNKIKSNEKFHVKTFTTFIALDVQ